MKKVFLIFCLLFLTNSFRSQCLNGVYTIGGTSPNYSSISAAVSDLNSYGVCGPVTFNIRPGTYYDAISINSFSGASPANLVTFTSENGDSSSVFITASNSSVINLFSLTAAKYVNFFRLSFVAGNASTHYTFKLNTGTANIFVRNCSFFPSTSGSNAWTVLRNNGPFDTLYFENNLVQNANYGIYTSLYQIHKITANHNQFIGMKNTALLLQNSFNTFVIGNHITCSQDVGSMIIISVTDSTLVLSNTMESNFAVGAAIGVTHAGSALYPALIANNYIQLGYTGTTSTTGIGVGSDFARVLYNTVLSSVQNSNSYCFRNTGTGFLECENNIFVTSGTGCAIRFHVIPSNVICNYNCLYSAGTYLGYYTPSNIPNFSSWKQTTGKDLNSLNINPYFAPGDFHLTAPLLIGAGISNSSVNVDIEGDARDTLHPDIGADEFNTPQFDLALISVSALSTPCIGNNSFTLILKNNGFDTISSCQIDWTLDNISQSPILFSGSVAKDSLFAMQVNNVFFNTGIHNISFAITFRNGSTTDSIPSNDSTAVSNIGVTLSGVYTIGGVNPDYVSLNAAVSALSLTGVCGPVVFNIRPGTYTEQITIGTIPGVSAANTVTFCSENGDSSSVIIQYSGLAPNNFVVKLNATKNIIFNKLTFYTSTGTIFTTTSTAGRNRITNCILEGVPGNNNLSANSLVYFNSTYFKDWTIKNNLFKNGTAAIYQGSSVGYTDSVLIADNIFLDQSNFGIRSYSELKRITRNKFQTNYSNAVAIQISQHTYDTLDLSKNFINYPNGSGIILNNFTLYYPGKVVISNNYVNVKFNGIRLDTANYVSVFYNTVIANDSSYNYAPFHAYGGQRIMRNNVFVNKKNGLFLSLADNSQASDNNCFFSFGNSQKFRYGNSYFYNFQSYQTQSGKDSNSVFVDPHLIDSSYICAQIALNDKGSAIANISNDIENKVRNVSSPDIGCFEFSPSNIDAGVENIYPDIVCSGYNDVYAILKNQGTTALTSVQISLVVNGITQPSVNWLGNLSSGLTDTVILSNIIYTPGQTTQLKCWTSSPNSMADSLNTNDTIAKNIQTSLSGTYTIGGALPDFPSFTSAISALHNYGVCGSVTFNIASGTYNEQLSINEIAGADSINNITFQSASGDSTSVTLQHSSVAGSDYTWFFNAAKHIVLKSITIKSLNPSLSNGIVLGSFSENIQIKNCVLQGPVVTSSSPADALIISTGTYVSKISALKNKIINGTIGISVMGNFFNSYLQLAENTFVDQYSNAIYVRDNKRVSIYHNTINANSAYSSYEGIYIYNLENFLVARNKVVLQNGKGIYLKNCDTPYLWDTINVICNNVVYTKDEAIYSDGSSHNRFLFNNVYSYGATGNLGAIAFNNSTFNTVSNCILWSQYQWAFYETNSMGNYNHNEYYRNTIHSIKPAVGYSASFPGYSNIYYYQLDTSNNFHDPLYYNGTDLITAQFLLKNKGKKYGYVTEDFLGITRDQTTPDIGAYEIALFNTDAEVANILLPQSTIVGTGMPAPIKATVYNAGATSISNIPVSYSVNGGSWSTTETITATLNPGDSVQYTFNQQYAFAGSGTAVLKVRHTLVNSLVYNDTLTKTIILTPKTNDVGIHSIQPSGITLGGNYSIIGIVKNYSSITTDSTWVFWRIDNGMIDSVITHTAIVPNDTLHLTVQNYNFIPGTHTIICWVRDGNNQIDQCSFNDTAHVTFTICAPLNGSYTVGSGGNYATIQDAAIALSACGSSGPVTLNVLPGTYYGPITLKTYQGLSASQPLTIQSANGDSTSVTIINNPTDSFAIKIDGANFISLKQLGFSCSNPNQLYTSKCIYMINKSSFNTIVNCFFTGDTLTYMAILVDDVFANNSGHNIFLNNRINGFITGIYFSAGIGYKETGNIVSGNYFDNQKIYGVNFIRQDSILITGNTFICSQGSQSSYAGIEAFEIYSGVKIIKNKVVSDKPGIGIDLWVEIPFGSSPLIANNFVSIKNVNNSNLGAIVGISITSIHGFNCLYNTVYLEGNVPQSAAGRFTQGSGTLFNNALINNASGYAIDIQNAASLTTGYNAYYTDSTYIIRDGFPQWWTVSLWNSSGGGSDVGSITILPTFVSTTDLHTSSAVLHNIGSPQILVTDDIDGEPRSVTTPCIGADEYNPNPSEVWPGDTDNNSVADNFDLLQVGLYNGNAGITRSITGNLWQAYLATDWAILQNNGKDMKHADCNGYGTVDLNDTLAIHLNYQSSHNLAPISTPSIMSNGSSLYYKSDTSDYSAGEIANIEVWIGDSTQPVSGLYGIGFVSTLNQNIIEPGTLSIDYIGSILDSVSTSINIKKINESNGTIDAAITRYDHIGVNGFGKIATIHFQIKNSLTSTSTETIDFGSFVIYDSLGNIVSVIALPKTIGINNAVGINTNTLSQVKDIYPNPANDFFTIEKLSENATIKLYDVSGRLIFSQKSSSSKQIISTNNLQNGVFLIEVRNEDGEKSFQRVVIDK